MASYSSSRTESESDKKWAPLTITIADDDALFTYLCYLCSQLVVEGQTWGQTQPRRWRTVSGTAFFFWYLRIEYGMASWPSFSPHMHRVQFDNRRLKLPYTEYSSTHIIIKMDGLNVL